MTQRSRYRDTSNYIRMVRRMIKAAGKRAAFEDPELLEELVLLRAHLDDAIMAAVTGMRDSGATWDDIGRATRTSRQAAHQKWANVSAHFPSPPLSGA